MAQATKNSPAVKQETWVWPLGQEDPLEEEMATNSSIRAWKIPWTEDPGAWGHKESDTTEQLNVRTKKAPWQASGGQGRPKSPLQRGWIYCQGVAEIILRGHQNSTNQYTPCSQVQVYQDGDENPPEKARVRENLAN